MSEVVKINAIEVAEGMGEELEKRFSERIGEVEKKPGFIAYQLLRPVEGETRYFVYTKWESEEAFQGWVKSPEFSKGHARAAEDRGKVAHGAALLSFEVAQQVNGNG